MTQHKNPCPGSHEIYNFSKSVLGHHYSNYILSLSESLEEFFRNTSILPFLSQITSPYGGGHEISNFLSPTLRMLHTLGDSGDLKTIPNHFYYFEEFCVLSNVLFFLILCLPYLHTTVSLSESLNSPAFFFPKCLCFERYRSSPASKTKS